MRIVLIITLLVVITTACQSNSLPPDALPTIIVFPTATAMLTQTPLPRPTQIATHAPLPAMTTAPLRIISPTPVFSATTAFSPTATPPVSPTLDPTVPPISATELPEAFIFGTSVEGRTLNAYRFGTGKQIIVLVGGIHTGFETNTVRLLNELRDYFAATPASILPNIAIVVIPVLNPDGLQHGRQIAGRFNANGVDLNRNWGCGWSATAVFKATPVSPGNAAFSEPESVALGSLIQQIKPAAVLFYHAAARGVFPGNCQQFVSDELAQVYSAASGYPYSATFSDYTVTGSAPAWVDSLGIPAIDVELASAEDSEFTRNLSALQAVMAWLTELD